MADKKAKPKPLQVTYKLKHPFEWGSEVIDEITFDRPKGKHLKKFGTTMNLGEVIGIAASCSNFAPPVFDEMDAEDYVAVGEIVGNFLDSGRGTGTNK